MKNLLDKLMAGARQYSIVDFGLLKMALLCAGILLGTYFGDFFSQYLIAVWIVAILCYGHIIFSTLIKAFGNRE